jgi:hypothetical protein
MPTRLLRDGVTSGKMPNSSSTRVLQSSNEDSRDCHLRARFVVWRIRLPKHRPNRAKMRQRYFLRSLPDLHEQRYRCRPRGTNFYHARAAAWHA